MKDIRQMTLYFRGNYQFMLLEINLHFKISMYYINRQYETKGKKKLIKNGRKLAIIIGILTVIVIGLLATLALQISIFHKEKYNEICQTEECVRTGTVKSRFFFFSPPSVSLVM